MWVGGAAFDGGPIAWRGDVGCAMLLAVEVVLETCVVPFLGQWRPDFSNDGCPWTMLSFAFPKQLDLFLQHALNFHTFLAAAVVPSVDRFYVFFFQFVICVGWQWFLSLTCSFAVGQCAVLNLLWYRPRNRGGGRGRKMHGKGRPTWWVEHCHWVGGVGVLGVLGVGVLKSNGCCPPPKKIHG